MNLILTNFLLKLFEFVQSVPNERSEVTVVLDMSSGMQTLDSQDKKVSGEDSNAISEVKK